MSKEKSIQEINRYLKLYSQEQLDLIEKIIETYSRGCIGKGMIMDLVYTREQRNKIDSALPQDYVNRIQELLPSFNTFSYVYNYNEPNSYGAMDNIFEALHIKLQTVLNNANFERLEEKNVDSKLDNEQVRLMIRELSTDLHDIFPMTSLEEWFDNYIKK